MNNRLLPCDALANPPEPENCPELLHLPVNTQPETIQTEVKRNLRLVVNEEEASESDLRTELHKRAHELKGLESFLNGEFPVHRQALSLLLSFQKAATKTETAYLYTKGQERYKTQIQDSLEDLVNLSDHVLELIRFALKGASFMPSLSQVLSHLEEITQSAERIPHDIQAQIARRKQRLDREVRERSLSPRQKIARWFKKAIGLSSTPIIDRSEFQGLGDSVLTSRSESLGNRSRVQRTLWARSQSEAGEIFHQDHRQYAAQVA